MTSHLSFLCDPVLSITHPRYVPNAPGLRLLWDLKASVRDVWNTHGMIQQHNGHFNVNGGYLWGKKGMPFFGWEFLSGTWRKELAGSLIPDTFQVYRWSEDERERVWVSLPASSHWGCAPSINPGHELTLAVPESAPQKWGTGITHRMKCLGELRLKGLAGCSPACPVLFHKLYLSAVCVKL